MSLQSSNQDHMINNEFAIVINNYHIYEEIYLHRLSYNYQVYYDMGLTNRN